MPASKYISAPFSLAIRVDVCQVAMSKKSSSIIAFDILLRGETDDVEVAAANVDKLRPPPESIERCFRWLSNEGVSCHKTEFGVACEATVEHFETLFGTRIIKEQSGAPNFDLEVEPQAPADIADLVSQITVARPPTFFT